MTNINIIKYDVTKYGDLNNHKKGGEIRGAFKRIYYCINLESGNFKDKFAIKILNNKNAIVREIFGINNEFHRIGKPAWIEYGAYGQIIFLGYYEHSKIISEETLFEQKKNDNVHAEDDDRHGRYMGIFNG